MHPHEGWFQACDLPLVSGQARFRHGVWLTAKRFGMVHLAPAQPVASDDVWYVISDELTNITTLEAYGFRFDIEENFLDDTSSEFQLESPWICSAQALERLGFVLAITTLYLVAQGTSVVQCCKRRLVDPHWLWGAIDRQIKTRGFEQRQPAKIRVLASSSPKHYLTVYSYLKMGWKWVNYALSYGYELIANVYLSRACAPEPAMASRKQAEKRPCRFEFAYQDAA